MASSRNRTTSKRGSSSKAGARKAQVEIVEESGDNAYDGGIAILTFLLLIAACVFLDKELGSHYGEGTFFKDAYSASK